MLAALSCIAVKSKPALPKPILPKLALVTHLGLSACTLLLSIALTPSVQAQSPQAPNNLGRVLEQAKARGLLIERGATSATSATSESGQKDNLDGDMATLATGAENRHDGEAKPRQHVATRFKHFSGENCDATRVLDFRPLKGLEDYGQLHALMASASQEGAKDAPSARGEDSDEGQFGQSTEIDRARFFLSFGLGAEAMAALRHDASEEAALLYQAASLIDHYSAGEASSLNFSDYAHCGAVAALWGHFEPASDPLEGEQLRDFITILSAFPPYLADRILLNIATLSAERGEFDVVKAFWIVMENRALDAGRALPQDQTDDAHLYLSALLSLELGKPEALGVLKYLSEKESVFRISALHKIVELQSGKHLSDSQVAGLNDIDFLTNDPLQKEQAARIRMNMYMAENAVIEAIDLVNSDMLMGSNIHNVSVQNIGSAVLGAVRSADMKEQLGGVNDYYYDQGFFKAFKEYGQLQTALMKAVISLELPGLAQDFQAAELSKEQMSLIAQANLLAAMQAGEGALSTDDLEADLPQDMVKKLLRNALRLRDFEAAIAAASRLTDESDKADGLAQIYWAQAQWTQLSQQGGEQAPQIVSLLAAPLLENPKLSQTNAPDGKSTLAVEDYFNELGSALGVAKEYLSHG